MRRVLLCYREQHSNSYVGGVVSIMRSYLSHKALFKKNDVILDSFCYQPDEKWEHVNSKIANVSYIFQQRHALKKILKKDNNVILNIHTSREFLFFKDVLLGKMARKDFNVPVVLTVHVGDISTVFNRISFARKQLIEDMNKHIDKVVFLTKQIQQQFVDEGLNIEKTEVLYNFHDLRPSNNKLQRTSKLHIMYMGALHREKGVIELLTALTNLQNLDFHIDICGKLTDQSIKDEFERLTKELGEKVEIHGYVSGEEKTELLNRADIFILPSYHEGMPLVILEALAAGCAIITTPVGGTPEILNEENVVWIMVKSSRDIEEAVKKMCDYPEVMTQFQQANHKLSFNYTLERNITNLCKIYSEVAGE